MSFMQTMGLSLSTWALASTLLAPLLLAPPVAAAGAGPDAPSLPDYMTPLWNDLWDAEPIAGVSGMLFVSEVENRRWLVHAVEYDEESGLVVVGVGFFDEIERVEIVERGWEDADYEITLTMFGVRGVLTGSTGMAYDLAGILQRSRAVHDEFGPAIADAFVPLEIIRRVERQTAPGPGTNITPVTGACTDAFLLPMACADAWESCRDCCWEDLRSDVEACMLQSLACEVAATAICAIFVPVLWHVCHAGFAALCALGTAACLYGAYSSWSRCKTTCDSTRLVCDPGWVPMACELIRPPVTDGDDDRECRWPR